MSWPLVRADAIRRGLKRRGKRRVLGKHADQSKHNIWRKAGKQPRIRQIPKWINHGILGLTRFA